MLMAPGMKHTSLFGLAFDVLVLLGAVMGDVVDRVLEGGHSRKRSADRHLDHALAPFGGSEDHGAHTAVAPGRVQYELSGFPVRSSR